MHSISCNQSNTRKPKGHIGLQRDFLEIYASFGCKNVEKYAEFVEICVKNMLQNARMF